MTSMHTLSSTPSAVSSAAGPRANLASRVRQAAGLLGLAGALLLAAQPAQADPHHWGRGGGWGGGWRGPGVGYYYGGPVFRVLPALATVLTIGAVTYWVADGQYYRAVPSGGYVLVAPPTGEAAAATAAATPERLYIYPRQGQGAEQQARDEYECHSWAVQQSGFDPAAQATGQATAGTDATRRRDYQRAQGACLDARGYTTR